MRVVRYHSMKSLSSQRLSKWLSIVNFCVFHFPSLNLELRDGLYWALFRVVMKSMHKTVTSLRFISSAHIGPFFETETTIFQRFFLSSFSFVLTPLLHSFRSARTNLSFYNPSLAFKPSSPFAFFFPLPF